MSCVLLMAAAANGSELTDRLNALRGGAETAKGAQDKPAVRIVEKTTPPAAPAAPVVAPIAAPVVEVVAPAPVVPAPVVPAPVVEVVTPAAVVVAPVAAPAPAPVATVVKAEAKVEVPPVVAEPQKSVPAPVEAPIAAPVIVVAPAAVVVAPVAAPEAPAPAPVAAAVKAEAKVEVPAVAEQPAAPVAVAAAVDLPLLSAYVWRGQLLNDELVLQPAITVTRGDLSIAAWGSLNLTDRVTDSAADFSEVDITVSYSHRFGDLSFTGGVIEYLFPNSTLVTTAEDGTSTGRAYPATRELFVSVSAPDCAVVPSISLFRDIDEVKGSYVLAGLSWTRALADTVSLTVAGSAAYADSSYNNIYFGVNKTALNDCNLGVSVSWKALNNLTVTPMIQATILPDSDIKDAASSLYKGDNSTWGGIKVSWSL